MIEKEIDLTNKSLGNYQITGKLGRGGMATVYKAHEKSLNRMVAIKILSPRLADDNDFIKRFQREAQAAAKLNHPNIVQIYSIGEQDGMHYFAMEYIKGRPLSDIKREVGILPFDKAISISKQVADALGEAHEAGLVHRDIKPSNIMIDANGRAKVTDFGIAHVVEAETKLTREGSIIGTPEYLSPEQCEGKTVDARSDLYSLGVMLYELIGGKTPYEADTPVSMLMKIVQGNFQPLNEINPNVPKPLQDVVEKLMQKNPNQRYANAAELITALESVERQLNITPVSFITSAKSTPIPATETIIEKPTANKTIQEQAPVGGTVLERPTAGGTVLEQSPAGGTVLEKPTGNKVIQQNFPTPQAKKKGSGAKIALALAAVFFLFVVGGGVAAWFLYFKDNKSFSLQSLWNPSSESTSTTSNSNVSGTTDGGISSENANLPSGSGSSLNTGSSGTTSSSSSDTTTGGSSNLPLPPVSGDNRISDSSGSETPAGTTPSSTGGTLSNRSGSSGTTTSGTSSTSGSTGNTGYTRSTGNTGVISGSTNRTGSTGSTGRVGGSTSGSNTGRFSSSVPAKSIAITFSGSSANASLLESYLQNIFSKARYDIVEGPSRYQLVVIIKNMPDEELSYFGRTEVQHVVNVTMKIIDTTSGRIVGSSLSRIVKYAQSNQEDNLKEAAQEMGQSLLDSLENR